MLAVRPGDPRGHPPLTPLPITRNHLYLASETDPAAVARLLELAQAGPSIPGGFDNLAPLVLRDGQWHAWEPGPGIADRAGWADLLVRNRGTWYAEAKRVLEARFAAEERDIFVGSFGAVELEDGTRSKLGIFCHVPASHVLSVHDVANIYHVPLLLLEQGMDEILRVSLELTRDCGMPQGSKRVIQLRFNMSVPRARVPKKASTLRDRSER